MSPTATPSPPSWENESKAFVGGGSVPHPELLYLQGVGSRGPGFTVCYALDGPMET